MTLDNEIQLNCSPFFILYKSGNIKRLLGTDVVPAGLDPLTGVTSKDLLINPSTNLSVRLYTPTTTPTEKLPILVYFHGGGFVIESASSPTYHNYLNSLLSKAKAIVVSVDYRLAPEHKLPTAYHDCWEALQWVASHAGANPNPAEPWLASHGDLSRVFLAGDSAGGNLAHNMAMQSVTEPLSNGVKIKGVALIHPYFLGEKPLASESEFGETAGNLWRFSWGEDSIPAEGMDDERTNPLAGGLEKLRRLPVEVALVAVAQKDFLRERGWAYCEALKESGWGGEVRYVESEGEQHVFYLKDYEGEKAKELMDAMVDLLSLK